LVGRAQITRHQNHQRPDQDANRNFMMFAHQPNLKKLWNNPQKP